MIFGIYARRLGPVFPEVFCAIDDDHAERVSSVVIRCCIPLECLPDLQDRAHGFAVIGKSIANIRRRLRIALAIIISRLQRNGAIYRFAVPVDPAVGNVRDDQR